MMSQYYATRELVAMLEVAKKLTKKDNVHMVGGYCNSAGAMAAKEYHITEKVPMIVFAVAGVKR